MNLHAQQEPITSIRFLRQSSLVQSGHVFAKCAETFMVAFSSQDKNRERVECDANPRYCRMAEPQPNAKGIWKVLRVHGRACSSRRPFWRQRKLQGFAKALFCLFFVLIFSVASGSRGPSFFMPSSAQSACTVPI
eukprot:s1948_g10.t1